MCATQFVKSALPGRITARNAPYCSQTVRAAFCALHPEGTGLSRTPAKTSAEMASRSREKNVMMGILKRVMDVLRAAK